MSASPAAGDDVSQGGETPIVEEPRCGVMSDGFLLLNRIGHDALFRSGLWQLAFVRCSFGELFGVVAIQPCASALCVPKTSSVLISRRNRLTSAHHDRAVKFHAGRLGLAI
jgi:hypothetical protein